MSVPRYQTLLDAGIPRVAPPSGAGTLRVIAGEFGGAPLGERVVGYGAFVMTSEAEIAQAIRDFQSGRYGSLPTGR